MTDEERMICFIAMAIYAVVAIILMAISKAWHKDIDEMLDRRDALFGTFNFCEGSSCYTPFIILWPLTVVISPFYFLYKGVYKLTLLLKKK